MTQPSANVPRLPTHHAPTGLICLPTGMTILSTGAAGKEGGELVAATPPKNAFPNTLSLVGLTNNRARGSHVGPHRRDRHKIGSDLDALRLQKK